jgi:hypothetical protein
MLKHLSVSLGKACMDWKRRCREKSVDEKLQVALKCPAICKILTEDLDIHRPKHIQLMLVDVGSKNNLPPNSP